MGLKHIPSCRHITLLLLPLRLKQQMSWELQQMQLVW
jgi:hypothetical protein